MRRARYRGENDQCPRGQNLHLIPSPSHPDWLFSTIAEVEAWRVNQDIRNSDFRP
jgi:hypothetical protein